MKRSAAAVMHRSAAVLAVIASGALAACTDRAVSPVAPRATSSDRASSSARVARVTTSADAGPGSFRQAVAAANADPRITTIRFDKRLAPIALLATVTFTGPQSLEIRGSDAVVDGRLLAAPQSAIVLAGGGDIDIDELTVRRAPGVGLAVLVPDDATGIIGITLKDVHVLDNGGHGVLVNDQTEFLANPDATGSAGSAAGLRVRILGSSFERNGLAAIDQDGLRVNEGGPGSIDAVIRGTRVLGNGGDGVELDERADGSVLFVVEHSALLRNGGFSAADFDDGIDVDEAGAGDIIGRFVRVTVNENFEQGVDLNENDAGDLRVSMAQVEASDNAEEGIEFEEDDDVAGGGDIVAQLLNVTTLRNGAVEGDAGLKLREKGAGDLIAGIVNPHASDNEIGGILVREDADGSLRAVIVNATANGNGADGIKFDENGAGNLDARLQRATASSNTGAGVAAEQALSGTGLLRINALTAEGNAGGAVTASGVTVERTPPR